MQAEMIKDDTVDLPVENRERALLERPDDLIRDAIAEVGHIAP